MMEVTVLLIMALLILFLAGIIIYDRRGSRAREQDLIVALLAKNLSEYALASATMNESTKDRIKKIKAENELAIANAKILEGEGMPVT